MGWLHMGQYLWSYTYDLENMHVKTLECSEIWKHFIKPHRQGHKQTVYKLIQLRVSTNARAR